MLKLEIFDIKTFESLKKMVDTYIQSSPNSSFSLIYIDIDNRMERISDFNNFINNFTMFISEYRIDNFYLGKDEFIIFLEEDLNETLIKLQEMYIDWNQKKEFDVTFSSGVVTYPNNGDNFDKLWRGLQEGLYIAKRKGRNRFGLPSSKNLILKSNYYYSYQLEQLKSLAIRTNKKESELLRESLDDLLRKYKNI